MTRWGEIGDGIGRLRRRAKSCGSYWGSGLDAEDRRRPGESDQPIWGWRAAAIEGRCKCRLTKHSR